MELKGSTHIVRIATPLQRIERKCYPKAQIGNFVLTKSAACAQKLIGDDWESSRRHAIITVRCKYASKKISQNGIVEKTIEYFCQFQYRRSGINVKNARGIFLRGMRIYIIRNRMEEDKTTMEWAYPPAPPDTLRKNKLYLSCDLIVIVFIFGVGVVVADDVGGADLEK